MSSTDTTETTAPYDHASDPAVRSIVMDLADGFHDLDDSDESIFGALADATTDGNVITVRPDQDPDNYAGEDLAGRLVDGKAPTTPVVRITVERIA